MTSKKRKTLPKSRNILRTSRNQHLTYGKEVAAALRRELKNNHTAAKTLGRWTGAGNRTVTNWLGGVRGPSGHHLVSLIGKSDEVFRTVLQLAKRLPSPDSNELGTARMHAVELLKLLECGLTSLNDRLPQAPLPVAQSVQVASPLKAPSASRIELEANDSLSGREKSTDLSTVPQH